MPWKFEISLSCVMHRVLCEPLFKEVLYVCFILNENKLCVNYDGLVVS